MSYHVRDVVPEPLYVVTTLFNPVRYKSRWKLYERFAKYVHDSGAILVTVEAAFGERHHVELAPTGKFGAPHKVHEHHKGKEHLYIKVTTPHELWIKENLVNIGISRLPDDWKYVAWVDADITMARPNWVGETIQQLQHYQFVQMFSYAVDLDPSYEPNTKHQSFLDCYLKGLPLSGDAYDYYTGNGPVKWHPGYSWAARREAIDAVGGLIDWGILGAGDNHMANALVGRVERSVHPQMSADYQNRLFEWQERAERHVRRNVGCMNGLLLHYWHGKKRDRRYKDRWQILVENQFAPSTDLKRDWQGLWQLSDTGGSRIIKLRDDIREYFRSRDEDSIDV